MVYLFPFASFTGEALGVHLCSFSRHGQQGISTEKSDPSHGLPTPHLPGRIGRLQNHPVQILSRCYQAPNFWMLLWGWLAVQWSFSTEKSFSQPAGLRLRCENPFTYSVDYNSRPNLGNSYHGTTHSCWLAQQLADRAEAEQGVEQVLFSDILGYHLFLELYVVIL